VDTVLVFRIGSLGDTVVALPCFHRIAQSFPNSRRIVVTDTPVSQKIAPVESILHGSGLIDGVIYFPPPPRRLIDLSTLRKRIRETGADTLIYVADRNLVGTLRDVLFFHACGIRHVIGAPIAGDLRCLRVDSITGETEREAERLARCLGPLGPIDLADPQMWDMRLQPAEWRAADAALASLHGDDFIAVGLGGKVQIKDWGNDNWSRLLQMMTERYSGIGLAFVGSGDESNRSTELAAKWRGRTVNLCGLLTPRESAAAMRRGLFFLGHDSGTMHLAAAVSVPCVALFGAMNAPKWWHPMGRRHRIIHDVKGICRIEPAQAMAAVDAMMSEMKSAPSVKAGG
jgi:heptosyltransferase-3